MSLDGEAAPPTASPCIAMTPEDRRLLRDLLIHTQVAALAVLVDGAPYAGLVPFAMRLDFSAALIHASDLAHHTAGLGEGAPFSLLIHAPVAPEADPLQLPRVSFRGRTARLPRSSPVYLEDRQLYLAKYPTSLPIFNLGDFNLYVLVVEKGRFVAAFGRAYNLSPAGLAGL